MKGYPALKTAVGTPGSLDTSGTNVLTSTFVDLVTAANMKASCSAVLVTNGGSQPLAIAKGAAGSEALTGAVIPPSGWAFLPLELAKSVRLSLKSLGGTQSTGFVTISFFQ